MNIAMLQIRRWAGWGWLFDTRNIQPIFLKDATIMTTITLISKTKPECLQMVFKLPDRDFMQRQEI